MSQSRRKFGSYVLGNETMETSEIIKKVSSFPRWHYEFDLKGVKTPIFDQRKINRHIQRKRYFFQKLVHLYGGTLKGKRILDLGCNAGYWALEAIKSGADYVMGIDGREMHIDQANFVFEVLGVNKQNYTFILGNLFDIDFKDYGEFDIVFYLGLMYHICKPVVLMEKIQEVNTDLLVIDTSLSRATGSFFEIGHDKLEDPRSSADYELVLVSTKRAVMELAQQFGYKAVILKPDFTDWTECMDYKTGLRKTFLLSKITDVSSMLNKDEIEVISEQSQQQNKLRRMIRYTLRWMSDRV